MPSNPVIQHSIDEQVLIYRYPADTFDINTELLVHENQEVVFLADGQPRFHLGAGTYELGGRLAPLMEQFLNNGKYKVALCFVNTADRKGVRWGTDTKVKMFDPISNLHVELAGYGEFSVRIVDSERAVTRLFGSVSRSGNGDIRADGTYTATSIANYCRPIAITTVKTNLAKVISANNINILAVDARLPEVAEDLRRELNKELGASGLFASSFAISNIATPDDDPNFRKMKSQYAERYLRRTEQEIQSEEAEIKRHRELKEAQAKADVERILAQGKADATRMVGYAKADVYHAQGFVPKEEITGWVCPNCGTTGNDGKFCKECGAKRPDPYWTCPSCGTTGNDGKFCKECGAKKPQ